jgi:hypothetical protein
LAEIRQTTVLRGGEHGLLLGQQEVAGIARLDLDLAADNP